jgi:hypothetical protein
VLKGLGDIIDGTTLKSLDLVGGIGPGGHEDDGNVARGRLLLQDAAGLKAIHTGHLHVQKDEIGAYVRHLLQGTCPIHGHAHLETGLVEQIA